MAILTFQLAARRKIIVQAGLFDLDDGNELHVEA